ncbi:hypothetical protein HWV01_14460 [Moritella sp. 5]|uniref:hypothetical protein n=1 Tax=Moritella sp. 5 TaxID=2746231 RepID=UPI001BA98226|nr:hypothetical protein [Moritella sp. 5]QUM81402.1 hypothetical protein HWV01_14460 [Moritella sp. 5]
MNVDEVLNRIITINHAWKLSREEFGSSNAITKALRDQKSSWQASLLRDYPEMSYLKVDTDNSTADEILYSVRLKRSIVIDGVTRTDAEHLPERIAKELFYELEIEALLKNNENIHV